MSLIAFELSMPSNNAWNGRWTGAERRYVRVRSFRKQETATKILAKTHHHYDFGDGWCAAVHVRQVDVKTARRLRKASEGFCGYDWMIDQIVEHGRILTLKEQAA